MSHTLKPKKGLANASSVYEILRRPDGSFDIFRNGDNASRISW